MSEPKRSDLTREIVGTIWTLNGRVDISHFIQEYLESKGIKVDSPWGLANFDLLLRQVKNSLNRAIEESSQRGITARYRFSRADSDVLIPATAGEFESARLAVKHAAKSLSDRAFERFCCHTLELVGVEKCQTIRPGIGHQGQEEGIDLFGVLRIGTISDSLMWRGASIRILGQATRSQVGDRLIRLFARDLQSFAEKEGRAWKLAPTWFKNLRLPIIGVFISGEELTGPARKWAMAHGIAAKDMDETVEDLLRFPGKTPGIFLGNGTMSFDRKAFESHFTRQARVG